MIFTLGFFLCFGFQEIVMEQLLSYFTFDIFGIIGLILLLIVVIIQLYFYLKYYNQPIPYYEKEESERRPNRNVPSVSVIIVAKNESENLEKNLPSILDQDYPDYEVIVVNDGSTDESEHFLKRLKREHSHLYHTFSPVSTHEDWSQRQKHRILSLTIGIKAATKDVLLFTEADTAPLSNKWISSMMMNLTPDKDIILGYCNYNTRNTLWGKIAIFDNLLFSLQYFAMAIKGKPYTGIYRNVAYRKNLFFDNKGFSSTLNHDNAEELFLHKIMTSENTTIALSPSSFVSCELESFGKWKFIKSNYMKVKRHFKAFSPRIFKLESVSRYLFYLLFISLIVYSSIKLLWVYLAASLLLFVIRFFPQFFILKKAGTHFQNKTFCFLLPVLDLLQPYYNSLFSQYSQKRNKKKR
ncbi:MAG: glycosyltransferase [Dysgonomonas sp.]|nr:glycosyltransferase [Dysgonomonas sp.]